jgi:hypothetical protein
VGNSWYCRASMRSCSSAMVASYFFLMGGRSVHTPSNTSAAMPSTRLASDADGWSCRYRSDRSPFPRRDRLRRSGLRRGSRRCRRRRSGECLVEQQLGETFVTAVRDRAPRGCPRETSPYRT